jgi:phosphopantothenoylcysteine synthetase/decarboxylase
MSESAPDPTRSPRHILLCVSGSIAAYKAASLASLLHKSGYELKCVMSSTAHEFIGPAALEGITGSPVYRTMFERPHEITHIALAKWADLIVIYPASASVLARLYAGGADDLISALVLANNGRVPVLIAPAMNSGMLAHPALQRNIAGLQEFGYEILPTEEGLLACGTAGSGRLLAPELAAARIQELLCSRS